MSSPVIMLEFNELSPSLMDRFIAEGRLPGFAALRQQSLVYVSDAEVEPPNLEPWIQWVTVHTGVPFEKHGIFDLNDGHKCTEPRIWDRLSKEKQSSWICGSMNAGMLERDSDILFLPDPWATGAVPNPANLFAPYFNFVSRFVQEHASKDTPVSTPEILAFVRFMVSNGLSAATVMRTVRQLLSERRGDNHWRRAVILDRLQWDVFRCFYRRRSPAFSTFFLNSTAHFQHYHWRDMEPELFSIAPGASDGGSHADAIRFGYEQMDKIVTECLQMAPDATIILSTALSQQPLSRYDDEGGKQVFKVKDLPALLEAAGIPGGWTYAPVMAEEFKLTFASDQEVTAAEAALTSLVGADGAPIMRVRRSDTTLFLGCAATRQPAEGMRFGRSGHDRSHAFSDVFFPLVGLKSGAHHPDGILWWRLPSGVHQVMPTKVSLERIAPTVLHLLDASHAGLGEPLEEVIAATSLAGRVSLAA
jgi:hypothetical protein